MKFNKIAICLLGILLQSGFAWANGHSELWAYQFQQGYSLTESANQINGELRSQRGIWPTQMTEQNAQYSGNFGSWQITETKVTQTPLMADVSVTILSVGNSVYHFEYKDDGSVLISGTTPRGHLISGDLSKDGTKYNIRGGRVGAQFRLNGTSNYVGRMTVVHPNGGYMFSDVQLTVDGDLNLSDLVRKDPTLFAFLYVGVFNE